MIDGSSGRPMRVTMSLCAGPLMDGQLSDLQPTGTALLCKYSWMGIKMADWQCRPVTPELFRIVLVAMSRIRLKLPSHLRETPPNHFQILPYEAGQFIDWHSDKTSKEVEFAHKSIIDGTGVLTIRCTPKGGPRAAMKFQFGSGPYNAVVAEFEVGGGDVFYMGPESDRAWKHRTQPHYDAGALCYTIVARWLGLWHPFKVPSDGPAIAAWSPERRAEWAARAEAATEHANRKADKRRQEGERLSAELARTFQPQMTTRRQSRFS